jgi:flagellar M-ring protein FliF
MKNIWLLIEYIKERWKASSTKMQLVFVSVTVAVIMLLVAGTYWIARDDYQVLFSDLSYQDAGAMVAELDRMKAPYRLAENGATILVERDAVYKTRLKLMAKGLNLHGTVGFEIFNNADFGATEFAQKVNYQRAMQGELARTIMGFDEIKSARVHLVLPDSGLFKRQNAKPKASVSLVMKGGSKLSSGQVAGIQRLVAASVPEITPGSVTIVDQHGTAISQQLDADESEQTANGRLDTKKQVEEYLTRKILNVLDRALGPGKATVSVDVSLNYDQIKRTREDILPYSSINGQSVGAITRKRESSQGGDILSDLQKASGNRVGSGSTPSSTSQEIEYINGHQVESVVAAAGNLTRLSVGVLVPGVTDPVELAKLKEIVSMTVGVNTTRGDAIAVYNVAQHTLSPTRRDEAPDTTSSTIGDNYATNISLWIAATILLFITIIVLMRNRSSKVERKLSATERDKLLGEIRQWTNEGKGKSA